MKVLISLQNIKYAFCVSTKEYGDYSYKNKNHENASKLAALSESRKHQNNERLSLVNG